MNPKVVYTFLIMLLSPIVGLVLTLRTLDRNVKKIGLILFITFYGSLIFLNPGSDGFVHQNHVDRYYVGLSFEKFLLDLLDILTFTQNRNVQEDVYIHLVSYLSGGIFGMPKLFFIIVAFVYAYFFIGSVFLILESSPNFKYSYLFYGFLIVFLFWRGIEGINTVRTWTGLWVMVYASLRYFKDRKFKHLLLLFAPPLCHVAYFAMAIPAWVVLFFGVRKYLYAGIFFLSFFINVINPQDAAEQLESNEVGESMVQGYYVTEQTDLDSQLQEYKALTWYRKFYKLGVQNYATDLIALLLIGYGYFFYRMNSLESSIFSIGLLAKALSSASWFIFALSNRSGIVAGLFILAALILVAKRGVIYDKGTRSSKIEMILWNIAFLGLLPLMFLKASELLDFVSVFIFSTPFFVWFMREINISIKDAIRLLLK